MRQLLLKQKTFHPEKLVLKKEWGREKKGDA